MREIKFRAKRKDTGQWYYFTLEDFQDSGLSSYFSDALDFSMFDKETLGQYIGLKDKNGREIYEGDIVRVITDKKGVIGEVVYIPEETAFCVKAKGFETFPFIIALGSLSNFFEIEVLGNIYENPELLEEE